MVSHVDQTGAWCIALGIDTVSIADCKLQYGRLIMAPIKLVWRNDTVSRKKVFVYIVSAALIVVFGFAAWLASQGRFLEAIALSGVATTLAWFVTQAIGRDD